MISQIEPLAGKGERTMPELEPLCRSYDAECVKLEEMIAELEADLENVKQKHLRGLKRQAGVVAAREAELYSGVEQSPGLFEKPRTVTMHGTKIGFTTSAGRLEWECEDATLLERIKARFGRSAGEYIRIKEEPNKDALKLLAPADMQKIGCRIEGAGDVVIVKRVAGDVEKLINKLIEKLVSAMVEKD